jgi:hypothetical protein
MRKSSRLEEVEMFTNRFFKLFMALGLAVIIALTVRGVVATANHAPAANSSTRIKQTQLEDTNTLSTTERNIIAGEAAAQAQQEQNTRPAQPDFNVLTGQAAAEAWAEKYGKPAQSDINVLTGQAKAEAWLEIYGKPSK